MEIDKMTTRSLEKRLLTITSKVPSCFPLLKGSVTIIGGENKQPRFSVNKKGKTYSTYLGKQQEKIAKQYVENYRNLIEIVNEVSDINLELIRRLPLPARRYS